MDLVDQQKPTHQGKESRKKKSSRVETGHINYKERSWLLAQPTPDQANEKHPEAKRKSKLNGKHRLGFGFGMGIKRNASIGNHRTHDSHEKE